jgi:hypothetical protein
MKTFFNILSAVLGICFFVGMITTDNIGEKIEYATLSIICYLDLIKERIIKEII